MSRVQLALQCARDDLDAISAQFALVGGLAVSARSEPRFTRDVDMAVAVADDREAERVVRELSARGYRMLTALEQEATGRLATARMQPRAEPEAGVVVDLLFASSGIEAEVVAAAEAIEVMEGLTIPVARAGHLIALKVLSRDDQRRPQDAADLRALIAVANDEELEQARVAAAMIDARGYGRDRVVADLLEDWISSRD